MTYKDYLDLGGEPLFKTKDVGRPDGDPKHRCNCGGLEFAKFMIDVRAFDIGDQFACGGCISSWERNMVPIMDSDTFLIRHEWRAKFIERRRGQKDIGAESVFLNYLEREHKKILQKEEYYASAADDHSDKVRLKARRIAIEKRILEQTI